jgi:hypothetical protein
MAHVGTDEDKTQIKDMTLRRGMTAIPSFNIYVTD